ncbi:MAG: cytochrome c-type biogenesis protein [Nevskiales bacterium]
MRLLILLMALLAAPVLAQQEAPLTPEQTLRYETLLNELRCMVCQNQNLAESNAPLAEDLRREVRTQVMQGKSSTEIKTYLTARYGDFVLYRPPFKPRTWLLWLGPAGLLVLALFIGWRVLRAPPITSPPPTDAEALRRILDEDERQ